MPHGRYYKNFGVDVGKWVVKMEKVRVFNINFDNSVKNMNE